MQRLMSVMGCSQKLFSWSFTSTSLLDFSVSAKGLNPQSAMDKMPGSET